MRIFQATTVQDIENARQLFREYETWLAIDLCFQSFEEELAALPGRYAPPDGRLLLAAIDDRIAGCVAMRKIDREICEMKRLFVRADFRGYGLGKKLIEKLMTEARESNYKKMRLDTLPEKMPAAVGLYQSLGFQEIAPYYDSPLAETMFLQLDL